MQRSRKATFATEADLCRAFISVVNAEEWTVYPETADFDILLVRKSDGFQIGVEAKLSLSTVALCQALEGLKFATAAGPDCRAILVPYGVGQSLAPICQHLGITIIQMDNLEATDHRAIRYRQLRYAPALPSDRARLADVDWHEFCPAKRCALPDYVPDGEAGHKGPTKLTPWKILALKIVILAETRGYVTRADFKHLRLDSRRWLDRGRWLIPGAERGQYLLGPGLPDFKGQHPVNYGQIKADIAKWHPTPYTASSATAA